MNLYVRCSVCGDKFLYEEQLYRIKPCCREYNNTKFIADARKALNEKQLSNCFADIERNDCLVGEVVIELPLYVVLKNGDRMDQGVGGTAGNIWGANIRLYSDEILIIEEEKEL